MSYLTRLAKTAQNRWEEDTILLFDLITFSELCMAAERPCNLKDPYLFPDWLVLRTKPFSDKKAA